MEKLVKRINYNEEESDLLEKIETFMRQYEMTHNLDLIKTNPLVCQSLNLSREELAELSSEDVLHHSYMIATHMNKLTGEYNREKVKMEFVSKAYGDAINHFLSKMDFPDYTKAETKEQMICEHHKETFKIRELMRKISTVLQLYEDRFYSLKRAADVLFQLSRIK
jgi:hypothetical protein